MALLPCEQHDKCSPCFLFSPQTACDNPFYRLPRVCVYVCVLWEVEAEGSSRLSSLSLSDAQSLSSVVCSLPLQFILPFFCKSVFLSLFFTSLLSRTFPTSSPVDHSGSISTKALFFLGTSSKCFPCLISPLTDEWPPHPASFNPFILQTHTYIFIYFCLILSLFQFTIPHYAHLHPCFVFSLEDQSKTFPSIMPSHAQCFVFREFPINPNGTISFTLKTNQGGALPRASASPQASRIPFHSHSGDSFSGPRLSGEFKAA